MARRLLSPFPLLLAVVSIVGACGPAAPEGPARRVILISCDTLRADRLGHYGYDRPTSPSLDALAAESVVFEEAYSTAPMTGPAMSSLFTGRYPMEIGTTHDNHLMVPPEIDTLAEVLARAGIPSAAVVSNFVLRKPRIGETEAGVSQGFTYYQDEMDQIEQNRAQFERLAPETTDAAIEWLSSHVDDGPYFFWVHYQDPHGPYTPPREYVKMFAGDEDPDAELPATGNRYGFQGIPEYQVIEEELNPDVYKNLYDAEIRAFDTEVGRLLDWLRDEGFYEDSLILFTSDHGESLGEHDYWFCHGENTHREVVRVPLLIRYLEGMERPPTDENGRCTRIASHLDIWSTVLQALGVEPPPSRGISLMGEIPERRLLGQFLHPEPDRDQWWAVGDGRFRVVFDTGTKKHRLYDIREDPLETNDLYRSNRRKAESMSAEFLQQIADIKNRPLPKGVQLQIDEETRQALEHLGYADHH